MELKRKRRSFCFKKSTLESTTTPKLPSLAQMDRCVTIITTSEKAGQIQCSCSHSVLALPRISLQGKTTLLNLIMGHLRPLAGNVTVNSGLRIGHFTQHHSERFDLSLSAVENMLNIFDSAEDQEMRSFLGKFQIQGVDALKPMRLLSGGQKSRVSFAVLAYQRPHLLIIDEGSNHLSLDAVDALVQAVQDFKGGVMIVSHDQYFVSQCANELWVVESGQATRFRGNFEVSDALCVVGSCLLRFARMESHVVIAVAFLRTTKTIQLKRQRSAWKRASRRWEISRTNKWCYGH